MTDKQHQQQRRTAVREASQWLVRLQDDAASDEDLQEWGRWMEASPANATAFDDVCTLWEAAAALDPATASAPSAQAPTPAAPLPAAPRMRGRRTPPRRRWRLPGIAAALALAAAGWWTLNAPAPSPSNDSRTISTAIGERRQLRLDDASTIELDAASEIVVRFSRQRRDVQLVRGQAFFEVAPAPGRPFVVEAGDVRSRVLGTRFGVNRRSDDSVAVTVVEGQVRVDTVDDGDRQAQHRQLVRDQQVRYSRADGLQAAEGINAGMATAWRNGTVVYQSERLGSVIDDLNRYSQRQVRLRDRSLEAMEVTGLWQPADIDAWIDGLADVLGLHVRREGGAIVLERASTPAGRLPL